MELTKNMKNPLSSFTHQENPIKLPNTPFPTKKYVLPQILSSSPHSFTPKTLFKSNRKIDLIQENPNQKTKNLEISMPTLSDFISNQKINITLKNANERTNNLENSVPTMSEIMDACRAQNLDIHLQKLGPFFRITAKSLETQRELGRAEGLIRVWFGGKILHLDSMRLKRETIGMKKSLFGIGLFIGAVAIRYGYDCGCRKAELLAINDTDIYHTKLVRFYKRLGFKEVYEVEGLSLGDMSHMLVWGGAGTRMDADIEDLMIKWCSRFKPATPNI